MATKKKESKKMKTKTISISALFLCMSTTVLLAQSTQDTVKGEKKIDEVKIIGTSKKGTESNIIATQRKSVEVIERVGAAQLEKQGIGDVATAVTKATGTQKQEGSGQIVIRGLGDRYNSTTLNGLIIPSDNPEFKNINLEIFKTSIVEYVSLDKVYNPRLSGDFGGANINIVSKEHSGKPYFKVGMGSSVNLQTFDKTFRVQDGNPGFFGYKESKFNKSGYPFNTKWNFKTADNPFNSNMDFETGFSLGKLSVFAYAGFENNYTYSKGKEGFFDSNGDAIKELNSERYVYNTNTTALLNLVYKLNSRNKIGFTSNFIHSSEQDARFFKGYMREIGLDVFINRGDNKITSTLINQLYGNHKIGDTWVADWGLGYNILNSKRPDRLQSTIDAENLILNTGSIVNNHRYFDDLKDNTVNGFLNVSKQFDNLKVNVGYNAIHKERKFNNTTIGINRVGYSSQVDPNDIDAFINALNDSNFTYGTFQDPSNKFVPFFYNFTQNIQSGYLNLDYKFSDKFIVQLGGRYDYVNIESKWNDIISRAGKKNKLYNKFLPALNAKYSINDRQNLRLSASKTYTLPQPKELVPIAYYDVTTNVYGNPNLYPSDNYNLDLKWEVFPRAGEIFSVTAFGKYIQNPIARTTYSTAASSDMTYFNIANWGYVFGAEMEIRKDIYQWGDSKLYTFLNGTYMHSQQKLKSEAEFAKENEEKVITFSGQQKDDVQGVADFLANVNLGYNQKFGYEKSNSVDFVVTYSYVGKSLFALGTNKVGNFYENPIHLLDTTIKFNLKQIGIGVTARNLINSENKVEQINEAGSFTHRSYTKGRQIGLNLSYKF